MTVQLRYAARSDVGLTRSNNQDSGYAGPHLLVLADGMGGPAGGDVASSVAVAHLAPLDDDVPPADRLLPLLRGAVESAHADLVGRSQESPELAGLGTTCIAILRSGNKLGMIHIGDSRAYLLRGGLLTQVTTDHTYVQHLVDMGRITPEEAEVHPNRNMILRALGDNDGDVVLDESVREARPGDRWLLCSDGLSGLVARDTIEETLNDIDDPGACADRLVDLALRAGGTDNVTVVIADIVATSSIPADQTLNTVPEVVGAAANKAYVRTKASSSGTTSASPAAKAAALSPAEADDDDWEEADPPRKRRVGLFAGILVVLALIAGGVWLAYQWSQEQYYVANDGGQVVIYRGIPQSVGPISLSQEYERTDLQMSDLSGLAQDRLENPITRGSLEDAQQVVQNLRDELIVTEPSPSPSPTSSPSPTPSGEPAPNPADVSPSAATG